MTSDIKFIGDRVLVPARCMYCVVLRPSGLVIGGSGREDIAHDMARTLELLKHEGDDLGAFDTCEVVRADKLKTERRKRRKQLKVSLAKVS